MPVIRIEIDKNGNVTIDHYGFVGRTCFELDEKLYEILRKQGAKIEIKEVKEKPEARVSTKPKTILKER